jgi:hypothetical protein
MVSEEQCPSNHLIHHRSKSCYQCLVASWLGKLFAVITSPRKTTKSTHNKHGVLVMLKSPKISQVANRCMAYISISREHHLCQVCKSDIGQLTHRCKSNYVLALHLSPTSVFSYYPADDHLRLLNSLSSVQIG